METSAFCLVVCLFFSPILFSYLKNNSNKSFYASLIINNPGKFFTSSGVS